MILEMNVTFEIESTFYCYLGQKSLWFSMFGGPSNKTSISVMICALLKILLGYVNADFVRTLHNDATISPQ